MTAGRCIDEYQITLKNASNCGPQEMHSNSQSLTSAPSHASHALKHGSINDNHFAFMFALKAARNPSQEEAAFATLLANYDGNGYKCVFSPTATPTLTQSGLLAVLLEHQRDKAIQLVRLRARREKMHATFWRTLKRLLHPRRVRTLVNDSGKPLIGTVPRHT